MGDFTVRSNYPNMEVICSSCLIFSDHVTMKVFIRAFASLALLSEEQWLGSGLPFVLFSRQNILSGGCFLWSIYTFCQHSKLLENFIENVYLILLYFVCAALGWNDCLLQMRLTEDCIWNLLEVIRGS